MRVAILSYKAINPPFDGYSNAIITEANALSKLDNEVVIFSIGKQDHKDKSSINGIKQVIVNGKVIDEDRITFYRLLDFLTLAILGFRITVKLIGKNKKLINRVVEFKPDIIILPSVYVTDLACKIKVGNRIKVISYTDSYKILISSFDAIKLIKIPRGINNVLIKVLKKKYLNYMKSIYKKMINLSDGIVVPTEQDKNYLIRTLKLKKRIFVIPPITLNFKSKQKKRIHVGNSAPIITFLGSSNYLPNIRAMEYIRDKLSHKLKSMNFIVVGKGWERYKKDNFNLIGEVKNLDPILDETDVFIAPITMGSGLKTKVGKYLETGKPIIGTSIAFEGYGIKNNFNGIIEDNLDNMAEKIYAVIKNKELIKKIQFNSRELVYKFSEQKIINKWKHVLSYIKSL